jgi:hypothetical protein
VRLQKQQQSGHQMGRLVLAKTEMNAIVFKTHQSQNNRSQKIALGNCFTRALFVGNPGAKG